MAPFTRDEVAAIAALAQLALDDAELDLFARQLGEILAYANQVQQVDTTGVPPMARVPTDDVTDRDDRLQPSLDRETVLAAAPDANIDRGFFRVPRVIG
jgi:aspartyl-tRNA(Asn)/glutamyl-tRNA(Gln) amidotransferase subunit C